jgi:ureidoacrylate peracid hydrolase
MTSRPFAEQRVESKLEFDPDRTAVLVVDMLNDFLEYGGAMVLSGGKVLYEPINRLLEHARQSELPIIWVCDEHPVMDDAEFEKRIPHCIAGSWGAEVVDALDVRDHDYRVRKRRYSGFFETDLDLRLRELKAESLIVTGLSTNICVRSTIHDAFFLRYQVIVPEDCVAATSKREQESTLYDIETHYGLTTTLNKVLEVLQGASKTRPENRLDAAEQGHMKGSLST